MRLLWHPVSNLTVLKYVGAACNGRGAPPHSIVRQVLCCEWRGVLDLRKEQSRIEAIRVGLRSAGEVGTEKGYRERMDGDRLKE